MIEGRDFKRKTRVAAVAMPGEGNLSRSDLLSLAAALEAARQDPEVGTVVLHGASGDFCSGLDLAEFEDESGLEDLAASLSRCFRAFALVDKPLVVSVNGFACGFGATMLCHADVVVASPRTRIRMPFVDLGLFPEAGSTLLLGARVGYLNAVRLLCLTEEIDAQEARRIGLLTEIVPAEAVEARAASLARDLARRPSDLLGATRALMRPDRQAVTDRIDVEVQACLDRLRDPGVRRRLARIATPHRPRFRPRSAA